MTGMCFFHSVDRETAKRVNTNLIKCSLFGHGICSHSASCPTRCCAAVLQSCLRLKNALPQKYSSTAYFLSLNYLLGRYYLPERLEIDPVSSITWLGAKTPLPIPGVLHLVLSLFASTVALYQGIGRAVMVQLGTGIFQFCNDSPG